MEVNMVVRIGKVECGLFAIRRSPFAVPESKNV